MRRAFWNEGSPREADPERVRLPNGNVLYDTVAHPEHDLYEVTVAVDAPCHPWQVESMTYELIDGKIKEIRTCTWPPIADLKTRKKALVTSKRREISSGSILIGGLIVSCTDGNLTEIDVLVSQSMRGRVVFPIKATMATGIAFQFTNVGEIQNLLDAVQAHRQSARGANYDHIVAIDALTDPSAVADYDYSLGWPSVVR